MTKLFVEYLENVYGSTQIKKILFLQIAAFWLNMVIIIYYIIGI